MEDENSKVSHHDSLAVAFQKEKKTPNLTSFKEESWAVYI